LEAKRCFVQFLHPGLEHGPDYPGGESRSWNRGGHRRKFLRSLGRYMDGGTPHAAEIVFWGEWEPQSRVGHLVPKGRGFPRYVHEPSLVWPPEPVSSGSRPPQNTDPFVFGSEFLYTCCQQYRNGRPTQLANLLAGSVILFGSHLAGAFVLDTVFVVASSEVRSLKGPLLADQMASDTYRLATIERIYGDDPYRWRLYRGATPEHQTNGMFSFFPCQIAREEPFGFARPRITLRGVINPQHKQGFKIRRDEESSPNIFVGLWRTVVKHVLDAGCKLGVEVALPPTTIRPDTKGGNGTREC
jgi:hypothetical protein